MWTDFGRSGHRMLSAEITQELQALAQRHGLDITAGGGKFGDGELKITVMVKTGDKSAQIAKARRELGIYGRFAGFTEDHYDQIAIISGDRWQLKGYHPSRPKYPIEMLNLRTGKMHKGTDSYGRSFIAAYNAQQGQPAAANASAPVPVFQTPQPQINPGSNDDDEPSVADILAASDTDLSAAVGGVSF